MIPGLFLGIVVTHYTLGLTPSSGFEQLRYDLQLLLSIGSQLRIGLVSSDQASPDPQSPYRCDRHSKNN